MSWYEEVVKVTICRPADTYICLLLLLHEHANIFKRMDCYFTSCRFVCRRKERKRKWSRARGAVSPEHMLGNTSISVRECLWILNNHHWTDYELKTKQEGDSLHLLNGWKFMLTFRLTSLVNTEANCRQWTLSILSFASRNLLLLVFPWRYTTSVARNLQITDFNCSEKAGGLLCSSQTWIKFGENWSI
jgi:hypothetical protein